MMSRLVCVPVTVASLSACATEPRVRLTELHAVRRSVRSADRVDSLRHDLEVVDLHGLTSEFPRSTSIRSELMADPSACGIAKHHPFVDGNRRAAFEATYLFLGLNGFRIDASEEQVVATILFLASGDLNEPSLSAWLRDHINPR